MTRTATLAALAGLAMAAPHRTAVHGHRGARAVMPENTIAAFAYAIGAGADVLELDVSVTKDDVLVVSHDPVLNPRICTGPENSTRVIREMTLQELRRWDCGSLRNPGFPKQEPSPGARVPELDEVLQLAGRGPFEFNIETKISEEHPEYTPSPDRFAELLVAQVRRHRLEQRVIVQSFDMRTLFAVKRVAPEIRLSVLFERDPDRYVGEAKRLGAAILSPEKSLAERVTGRGFQVVPWTANTPGEWDRLVRLGVAGIITDDPAALIAFLSARGMR